MPTIGFDTSGINALEDGGRQSELLMIALRCGFDVRLPAMTADEVLSTPDPARREALLARCERLLGAGECLLPPHEILRLLISEHHRNPLNYDWTQVDVRARVYEIAILRRDFTNELCVRQREEQLRLETSFRKMWDELRPKLDEVLINEPSKRPTNFHEAATIATIDGGVLWGFGRELYRHVTGTAPSEAEIKEFMALCVPFRTECYGLVMAWFNGALKLKQRGEPESPGRNDLMMAGYLPYCGRFVARDWPQEKSLREVASVSDVPCEILSYHKFESSFTLPA